MLEQAAGLDDCRPSPFSCPCGDPLLDSLRPLLEPSLHLARDGQQPESEATTLASGELALRLLPGECKDVNHAATLSRALYQQAVSWAVFTEEWLDALASLLKSCGRTRVLELAAGAGVLAAPMRRRGLLWRTTDRKPAHIAIGAPPEACDALAALARFGDETDAVFWSWWPSVQRPGCRRLHTFPCRREPPDSGSGLPGSQSARRARPTRLGM